MNESMNLLMDSVGTDTVLLLAKVVRRGTQRQLNDSLKRSMDLLVFTPLSLGVRRGVFLAGSSPENEARNLS